MKTQLLLLLLFVVAPLCGQTISLDFNTSPISIDEMEACVDTSEYNHAGYSSTFASAGLKGRALDLTDDVEVRIPVFLNKETTPDYGKSFSISVWVKTKPGARQGTAIMGNKKNADFTAPGWLLGTNDLGAWYFNVSDGKARYDYEPTANRQAINDGKWHNIVVSADFNKKEIWFYFDGRNVAIYNTFELKSAASDLRTVVGGTDEYADWGSRGEWTAFNGWIDEAQLSPHTLTPAEVASAYRALQPGVSETTISTPDRLKMQIWNIWHGGHRFGQHVGVARVIDVLKETNADVIGLIETYGSGAVIADSLGYYFYLISSNLSILSRYPIEETVTVYHAFNSGGALLDLGEGKKMAFFDVWLDYLPDITDLSRGTTVEAFMANDKKTRQREMKQILKEIKTYTEHADQVPVFLGGDFNCGSHLDWNERTKTLHNGIIVDWQTSRSMLQAGYKDSYRVMNPDPLKDPGFTWSPLISPRDVKHRGTRDRIDFLYYKGAGVTPYQSHILDYHPRFWPSDHASLVSWFYVK